MPIELPESLKRRIESVAAQKGCTLTEFLASEEGEKLAEILIRDHLRREAEAGHRVGFEEFLFAVPDVPPPESDRLPDAPGEPPEPRGKSSVPSAKRPRTAAERWAGIMILTVVGIALATPLVLAVRPAIEANRRSVAKERFRALGVALHAYHEEYNAFPPAYVLGPDGKPRHSWRVLLLPFLDNKDLHAKYRFDEPWDGPNNRMLHDLVPDVFVSPRGKSGEIGISHVRVIVGRATIWPENQSASLRHVLDGPSNTVQLVEDVASDANWLEPRDLVHHDAMDFPAGTPDGFHVLLADGAVRLFGSKIDRRTWGYLLTISSGAGMGGVAGPVQERAATDFGPLVEAERLAQTDIQPVTDLPLAAGRNVVYCATFAMAWKKMRELNQGWPIKIAGNPPLADLLNAQDVPAGTLDAQGTIIDAGHPDDVIPRVRAEFDKRFPGFQSPILRYEESKPPSPFRRMIYAMLSKTLAFAEQFDRLPTPLEFATGETTKRVEAFGLREFIDVPGRATTLKDQVRIASYISDEDIVIKLLTVDRRDEIILAKVTPSETFEKTVALVLERASRTDQRETIEQDESLAVPLLRLNVLKHFRELEGRDADVVLELTDAIQVIRFRLDEYGARLESEAEIVGENGHSVPPPPPRPRKFIFDRPFLLLLKQTKAARPYFAAWIGNAELMEAAKR